MNLWVELIVTEEGFIKMRVENLFHSINTIFSMTKYIDGQTIVFLMINLDNKFTQNFNVFVLRVILNRSVTRIRHLSNLIFKQTLHHCLIFDELCENILIELKRRITHGINCWCNRCANKKKKHNFHQII